MTGRPPALRLAFFGTPDFAVPTFQALLDSRHAIAGVVTQPDRPRGRGQRVSESPVKQLARAHGLPVLQPLKLREEGFLRALDAWGATLGIVAAYGRILPDELLARVPMGLINVHASLLPRYRGAAPVHRAVMAGETVTGVTIMRIVKALDAGPMLARTEHPIGPEETSVDVERALAHRGAALLVATVDRLAAGADVETPQDERLATYAPRLTREDGLLDWRRPALEIHNAIRGLHPWPHASSYLRGTRYLFLQSRPPEGSRPDVAPGRVLVATGDDLAIGAGDGRALRIVRLQREGRRPMSVREFLAGHPIQPGESFGAPGEPMEPS